MNSNARLALGALVAVIAAGGAIYLLGPQPGSGPGGPAPTPTILPTTAPSSTIAQVTTGPIDTATWTTYVSDRYGFSIGHPADWSERPSDHVWTFPADAEWLNTASESFGSQGDTVRASAWSASVTPGTTVDSWLQTYCPKNTTPCGGLQARAIGVTMDGHPGLLVPFKEDTQAFILVGDRMYVVAVWEPDSDPRAKPYGGAQRLLEGYLSTMRLLPAGPAPSATAPRPS